MMFEAVVLVACPVLFAAGAMTDLVSYKIPNWIPVALAALFALAAALSDMPLATVGWHALTCFCVLIFGMGLFAFGLVGGGDAKFFAAGALWVGPFHLMKYGMVFALIGGAFAIALLMLRKAPLPTVTARIPVLNQLLHPKAGMPYGVALGLGALLVLPSTPLFVMALAA